MSLVKIIATFGCRELDSNRVALTIAVSTRSPTALFYAFTTATHRVGIRLFIAAGVITNTLRFHYSSIHYAAP